MSKKPAMKPEDLFETVKDPRIIELITNEIKDNILSIIESSFNKLAQSFLSKLESMVEKASSDLISRSCETFHQKISTLEKENTHLALQLEASEKTARLNNLVVHGLPESALVLDSEPNSKPYYIQHNQAAARDAMDFITTRLLVPITNRDISIAYRIPTKTKGPRPMLIGFVGRMVRDEVFAARRSLWQSSDSSGSKTSAIYVSEHLTQSNSLIYAKTRQMKKDKRINSTWTSGGNVFIKRSDSSDEKPIKVNSLQQLDNLLPFSSNIDHSG